MIYGRADMLQYTVVLSCVLITPITLLQQHRQKQAEVKQEQAACDRDF